MTTEPTAIPKDDDNGEHKFNRKEVIHLGFQNKTKGEAAFNLISYVGFGYFVVTATSVLATWALRDFGPVAKRFEKYVTKPVSNLLRVDTTAMNIATLFTGGTIASVLPVKWLEERKSKVVKKLDYMLYDEDKFYNDPKIQAAHKELEELPKQTWMTVFGSRVVAFAATFGVFFLMGGNKSPFAKKFKSLDELSINGGRWLDRTLGKNNPNVAIEIDRAIATNKERMLPSHGEHALAGPEVVRDLKDANGKIIQHGDRIASRVYSYIGLDAFYTLITSASLWVSTRVLGGIVGQDAKKAAEKAERKLPHVAPATGAAYAETAETAAPVRDTAETTTPPTKVTAPIRMERVVEPSQSAELTA